MQDGENVNNFLEIVGDTSNANRNEARARLLSDNGTLTEGEREEIKASLFTSPS